MASFVSFKIILDWKRVGLSNVVKPNSNILPSYFSKIFYSQPPISRGKSRSGRYQIGTGIRQYVI